MSDIYPTAVASALMPSRSDHKSYSHICTLYDSHPKPSHSKRFEIPYSEDVTWTHFRTNWIGPHKVQYLLVWESADRTIQYDLRCDVENPNDIWHCLPWPILSIDFKNGGGFTLYADYPTGFTDAYLQIQFCGYESIIPYNKKQYILLNNDGNPLWNMQAEPSSSLYSFERASNDIIINPSSLKIHTSQNIVYNSYHAAVPSPLPPPPAHHPFLHDTTDVDKISNHISIYTEEENYRSLV